ncbi:glycosyltransferase [Flammeovirga sp. SJP92]|uniref:glycosyltransferase n=1 Tax=Flammeovirga sp. SJP92 TaxID=1775430 RepID=UPI0007886FA7|nr:glycosyltransferase [Flammeovirga sp. SJP92]KXX68513.1 hypothetical protein AVL50_22370 [Flammeovirga sp. SJP92]
MRSIDHISAVMILKNAEACLEATLESLKLFKEVIILDNGSTDRSLEIAAKYENVKVYHSEFIGFGPLKNLAVSYANNDWIFSIDSDEVPDPTLLEEIIHFDLSDTKKVATMHRVNEYLGKVIAGTDWGNEIIVRLFNKRETRFTDTKVHETIVCGHLKKVKLKGKLLHESYTSVAEMITKMQFYTSLYAEQNVGSKDIHPLMIILKGFFAFIRSFLFKGGFKYGWRGLLVSSYVGIDVLFKYFKLYELNYKRTLKKATSDNYKVLIDLERLKYPNCGLGQVSINFSNALTKIEDKGNLDWEFLLPSENRKNYINDKEEVSFRYHNALTKNGMIPVDKDIDLFHLTHQITAYKAVKARKNIYTIHDLNFLKEKNKIKADRELSKIQKAVNRADVITVISKFTEKVVRDNLTIPPSTPVKVIYNGVKSPILEESVQPKIDDSPFFFSIGTVMPKKNFHVLVAMMEFMDPKYKLYLAGQWEKYSYVHQIRDLIEEKKLQDRVKLLGPISDQEKSYLFKNCEGFLFPSLLEGFGLPIIESMLAKKPTFSSNKTSLPEVGGEYAYYWENFKPEYMADVVKEGLKDFNSDRTKKEQEVYEYASNFSWEKNAEEYNKLYIETLNS